MGGDSMSMKQVTIGENRAMKTIKSFHEIRELVANRIPFKNRDKTLTGELIGDGSYIVRSYRHEIIFIYHKNHWYEDKMQWSKRFWNFSRRHKSCHPGKKTAKRHHAQMRTLFEHIVCEHSNKKYAATLEKPN